MGKRVLAALLLLPLLMLPAGCGPSDEYGRTPTSQAGPAPKEPAGATTGD